MAKSFRLSNDNPATVGRVAPESAHGGPALARARKLRSSARWQKCSKRCLAQQPCCCDPFNIHTHIEAAQHVHHIEPVVRAPHRLTDPSNLASLCIECHARIEGMERAGKPTQNLFNQCH